MHTLDTFAGRSRLQSIRGRTRWGIAVFRPDALDCAESEEHNGHKVRSRKGPVRASGKSTPTRSGDFLLRSRHKQPVRTRCLTSLASKPVTLSEFQFAVLADPNCSFLRDPQATRPWPLQHPGLIPGKFNDTKAFNHTVASIAGTVGSASAQGRLRTTS